MPEAVKLMRCPIDTNCKDCKKRLSFGVWVYYNPDSGDAICPDCGVKRGWSSRQRVNQLIRKAELQEDLKALGKERKIQLSALMLLKKEIDLHRLGENDIELEKQILKLMQTVEDYLSAVATPKEEEALAQVFDVIRGTQDLQKELREKILTTLFHIEKKKKILKPLAT